MIHLSVHLPLHILKSLFGMLGSTIISIPALWMPFRCRDSLKDRSAFAISWVAMVFCTVVECCLAAYEVADTVDE